MVIIAVANPAGGTGKTTTARAIATSAVEYGKRTVLVDMDERATLTFFHGVENPRHSSADVLQGRAGISTAGLSTAERYTFIPSSARNSVLERNPDSAVWSKNFGSAMASAEFPIDVVVLDLPSSISQALAWGVESATKVVVPFTETIGAIRGAIQVKNIRATEVHGLAVLQKDLGSEFATELSQEMPILDTAIPKGNQVGLGELKKQSVLVSSKESAIAQAYREMTYFLLGL